MNGDERFRNRTEAESGDRGAHFLFHRRSGLFPVVDERGAGSAHVLPRRLIGPTRFEDPAALSAREMLPGWPARGDALLVGQALPRGAGFLPRLSGGQVLPEGLGVSPSVRCGHGLPAALGDRGALSGGAVLRDAGVQGGLSGRKRMPPRVYVPAMSPCPISS